MNTVHNVSRETKLTQIITGTIIKYLCMTTVINRSWDVCADKSMADA